MTRPIQKTLTFTGAGEREIQVTGRFILINEASGAVYLSVAGGSEIKLKQGSNVNLGEELRTIRIRSAIAQTVLLTASDDRQEEIGDINATVSATIEASDTINTPLDVAAGSTASLLIAGNANRKEVEIGVKDSAANGVRVGGSGVTSGRGSYIAPGTSKFFANTAALYAVRDGASDVDVYIFEQEKP